MNGDLLEPRLSRAAALRLAAAGAAGLALGVRPARATANDAADIESAARAYLASLSPAERARASFPFGSAERTRWHWTVPSSVPRNGLPLGAMSPEQRGLALALLRASSSAAGYRKAVDIMALQGVLGRLDTGIADPFDPDLFYVSVFGTPGAERGAGGSRGITCRRHFTIVGNTLVAEPFFLGAWPTRADSAYRSVAKGYRTMPREEDAAREIVLLLDRALRRRVVFSTESLTDHLTQNAVRVSRSSALASSRAELPSAAQRRGERSCARTSRTILRRWRDRRSRASSARAGSPERVSAGPAAHAAACPTTTGCRDRRSCSSSTTPGTAAPTSTACGATSSGTSAATFSEEVER